jgi:hypothetical protein
MALMTSYNQMLDFSCECARCACCSSAAEYSLTKFAFHSPLGFSVADFTSPIITLEVGPEATIMTAHKAILTKSDYFAKCLKNFKEGVENRVKLLDDRPVDTVLHVHWQIVRRRPGRSILQTLPSLEPSESDRLDYHLHRC